MDDVQGVGGVPAVTGESWSWTWRGEDGVAREVLAQYDEGERGTVPLVVLAVFNDSEHASAGLDEATARSLAAWLVERVGLPPTFEH